MHHGLTEPKNARVLYVDMNAFYASIEQQYHPELRDIPVAVASHLTGPGTVLASSYEAKALGIVTGMKLRDAKDRYPNLAIVETDHIHYRSVHVRLNNLLVDLFGPLAV
jgi:DNA polymerase-4